MLLLLLMGVAGAEACRVLLGKNFHTVLPGKVYRGAQLSPAQLTALIKSHNIQTVINLRGCCNPNPWYVDECRVSQELQIVHEDVGFSAGRLPPAQEVRRLIEVLDHVRYPVYLHCFRGADRTGVAAAIVLLLHEGTSHAQAQRQLSLRYGHLALGRPRQLHRFMRLYNEWLSRTSLEHSPATFRRWALEEYGGGWCRYRIEHFASTSGTPLAGEPLAYQVRVRNLGVRTWHMRPGLKAGIHLGYMLFDPEDNPVDSGRSGLLEADVAAGQTIDLTLVVPPIAKPGRYRLLVDLADEGHCWFFQAGAEPLEEEIHIRE